MATPFIGAFSVFSIDGPITMARQMSKPSTRPGVPGHDVRLMGVHGSPKVVPFRAKYTSEIAREAGRLNFNDLNGAIVTIITNAGTVWTNVLILRMEEINKPRSSLVTVSATGGNNYPLDMEMEIQSVATSH